MWTNLKEYTIVYAGSILISAIKIVQPYQGQKGVQFKHLSRNWKPWNTNYRIYWMNKLLVKVPSKLLKQLKQNEHASHAYIVSFIRYI